MSQWYVGSVQWTAVTAWAASSARSVGDLRRQLATPTVGNERVWRCTTAGTTGSTEPAWTLTAGSTTSDGTVTWTEVTGQSTYGWSAAHARISNACGSGWMAAGDTAYVANNHAATTTTGYTVVSPGTSAAVCNFICVSTSATPPTATATTAVENMTGNSTVSFAGYGYASGITFRANGAGGKLSWVTTGTYWRLENCLLDISANSTFNNILFGLTAIDLLNTPIKFGNAAQTINITGNLFFRWENTANGVQGTSPTTLLNPTTASQNYVEIDGVDMSGATGSLIQSTTAVSSSRYIFQNCKLNASATVLSGAIISQSGVQVDLINCDSGANYRNERYRFQGSVKTESTVVRSSGASDGTTTISRKAVSLTGSVFGSPLEASPIEYWNDAVGSPITITVPIINDGSTLTNGDIWVEVEYLGTSGVPLSSFASSRVSDLVTTVANNPTDSTSSWTTTGLTTPILQSLSVNVTPQVKGLIKARVMLAKASTTVWYDPKILSSATKTYRIGAEGDFNVAATASGGSSLLRSKIIHGVAA